MPDTDTEKQAPRTQRVGVMVTPEEKRAVQLVALLKEVTESDLLRDRSIEDIVAEAAEIRNARGLVA